MGSTDTANGVPVVPLVGAFSQVPPFAAVAAITVATATQAAEAGPTPVEVFQAVDKAMAVGKAMAAPETTEAPGAMAAHEAIKVGDKSIRVAAIRAAAVSSIPDVAIMAAVAASPRADSTRAEATSMEDVSGRGRTSASESASHLGTATIRIKVAATMTDTAIGTLLRVTIPATNGSQEMMAAPVPHPCGESRRE